MSTSLSPDDIIIRKADKHFDEKCQSEGYEDACGTDDINVACQLS